jgi:hypothetical protein
MVGYPAGFDFFNDLDLGSALLSIEASEVMIPDGPACSDCEIHDIIGGRIEIRVFHNELKLLFLLQRLLVQEELPEFEG